jgi:hypothetical protein
MHLLLGVLVLLHALAHAGVGMWAAGPPWLVTPLLFVAMCGWLVTAFGLLGMERFSRVARPAAIAATVASVVLARLAGTTAVSLAAIGISGLLVVLAWRLLTVRRRLAAAELFDGGTPAPARRTWPRALGAGAAYALLAWVGVVTLLRPVFLTWGSTPEERATVLPGDALQAPGGRYRIDHAVTVRAPCERVFPWLAQIGQDRAGFYSYDWLERVFGDDVHNADSLVPAWQQRKVGDLVRAAQPTFLGGAFGSNLGWRITLFDPPRAMVLENWGAFVVVPVDSASSRLIVRTRGEGTPSLRALPFTPFGMLVFEPAHFLMQRKMLWGIKARAEGAVAKGAPG